jgi:RNAse (barnase) inhibitor barstar
VTESIDDLFMPEGFQFADDIDSVDVTGALVIRIPSGLLHKRDLFKVFASRLSFPKYFGWNWDAFEECLHDLSWLKNPTKIFIIHESLPFQPDWENRGIYLQIVESALSEFRDNADSKHTLKLIFPSRMKREVLVGEAEE